MSSRSDEPRHQHEFVKISAIQVAVVLSLLIHAAALWQWLPEVLKPPVDLSKVGEESSRLQVRIVPAPSPAQPPPAPAARPAPPPARSAPPPPPPSAARPPPPRPAPPPVAALAVPEAPLNLPTPSPPPRESAAPPARPSIQGDMFSMLQERRRARGEVTPDAPSPEEEKARHSRAVAESLGLNRPQSFGFDPRTGGGVFQIERMGFDSAEFLFFGWNKEVRRNTRQLIEVRRGSNPDTRVAVVRKMISIIREHEKGDFVWESRRLGRNLILSAKLGDNAGLEEFLMQEFFEDPRGRR
ncbi:MAG: hypothetical protein EXR27_02515 [Betaproteobacteria bacterium]|nr:hypothetical protein [Betaproteobacteria bacterium]